MLKGGNRLIAVVNAAKLENVGDQRNETDPNHAVVIIDIDKDGDIVTLFDPQTGNVNDTYSIDTFCAAWADSQNFLVVANNKEKFVYNPQPIDLADVTLDAQLEELGEAIAENAHEVWAICLIQKGTTTVPWPCRH